MLEKALNNNNENNNKNNHEEILDHYQISLILTKCHPDVENEAIAYSRIGKYYYELLK